MRFKIDCLSERSSTFSLLDTPTKNHKPILLRPIQWVTMADWVIPSLTVSDVMLSDGRAKSCNILAPWFRNVNKAADRRSQRNHFRIIIKRCPSNFSQSQLGIIWENWLKPCDSPSCSQFAIIFALLLNLSSITPVLEHLVHLLKRLSVSFRDKQICPPQWA